MNPRAGATTRAAMVLAFFIAFALVAIAIHFAYLRLPYFWDEAGQYVPAALDIYRGGHWIPKTTSPNAHPPAVMAYLALIWTVAGYSIPATRVGMLLLSAVSVLGVLLLSIRLCRGLPGAPAFYPVLLLFCSPLFYGQAMLAQLDMPAMVFTILVLYLFLEERHVWAVAAGVCLVLSKETGGITVGVLGLVLILERRFRTAALYAIPCIALALWLIVLKVSTGEILGSSAFTAYNLFYPLHPVRLGLGLIRRIWTLFIDHFHWIGTMLLVLSRGQSLFARRDWRIAGWVFAANVLTVTVLGGATLERYLLPALPVFYIAVAAAASHFSALRRNLAVGCMALGMVAMLFVNPPYPFPLENNLAFTDFVELQQTAAEFVERNYAGKRIASVWPATDELRRPDLGYVSRPQTVIRLEDFRAASMRPLLEQDADVLILYSRSPDPSTGLLRYAAVRKLLARYYDYRPQITAEELLTGFHMQPVAFWERGGQWIQVYVRGSSVPVLTL